MEDEHISQSHNKGLLLYHLVFGVESSLRDVCIGISQRYEVNFVEIGVDEDHVHFLIQSVPMLSITQIVKLLKNLIARQLFQLHPDIKKQLGVEPLVKNTVGLYASKEVIQRLINRVNIRNSMRVNWYLTFECP